MSPEGVYSRAFGFGEGRNEESVFICILLLDLETKTTHFDCPDLSPLTSGSPFCVFSALRFSSSTTITEKDGRTFTFNWEKGGNKSVQCCYCH